jgi:hypothetical protein
MRIGNVHAPPPHAHAYSTPAGPARPLPGPPREEREVRWPRESYEGDGYSGLVPYSVLKGLKMPVFGGFCKAEDLPPHAYRNYLQFEPAAEKYMRAHGMKPHSEEAEDNKACKCTLEVMCVLEAETTVNEFNKQWPHATYQQLKQHLTSKYMPQELCKSAEAAMQSMRWANRGKGVSTREYLEEFMRCKSVAELQLTLDEGQVWRWFLNALSTEQRKQVILMQDSAALFGRQITMLQAIQSLVKVSGEAAPLDGYTSMASVAPPSTSGPAPMDLSQLSISMREDGAIVIAQKRDGGDRDRRDR